MESAVRRHIEFYNENKNDLKDYEIGFVVSSIFERVYEYKPQKIHHTAIEIMHLIRKALELFARTIEMYPEDYDSILDRTVALLVNTT